MKVNILTQPDDNTCGPTSLHAVYDYFGHSISLEQLIREIKFLEDGGTLAVYLGIDALKRGFDATIYSYNLKVFDPTWAHLSGEVLIDKLNMQKKIKSGKKFGEATAAYIEFLEKGGKINFQLLNLDLLQNFFRKKLPVLAGLSATYLYNCKREYTDDKGESVYDDLKGKPMGHFVVLCGVTNKKKISIADPYKANPITNDNYYEVSSRRLINSILLGIVTYDANLLVISRKKEKI